ncbi:unnamed protein product [Porites lobata]|uniref:YqaJ viral recombinase domain-containing protein n=1 Tax=Porites lobata TaxID=104759 RepID=A0ABN8Q894_9CNID|nr:unnamed protein product [Porites lobata]
MTSMTTLSKQAVSELFPPPKRYCALSRNLKQADRFALYEDLKEYRNEHKVARISQLTVSQRDNPAWHLARTGRLTASNFGSVLKAKRVTSSLDTGIWFDSSGILGASPDGIVDDRTVLESKCWYTEQNLTIDEALNSTSFHLEERPCVLGSSPGTNVLVW